MKITILSPSLSSNGLGRAYLLAKVLQRRWPVEIIGPMFGPGIWPPVAHAGDVPIKPVKISNLPRSYLQIAKLFTQPITGDVIYACKEMLTSFGVGLYRRHLEKKPLVVDIDDWDRGLTAQDLKDKPFPFRKLRSLAYSTLYFYEGSSYWNTLLCDQFMHRADAVTVSNSFLQNKFGGTIVWHGRDTTRFDPALFDGPALRKKHQLQSYQKVVMFFGTPSPHKGLDDLVSAMAAVQNPSAVLVIVGLDDSPYCRQLAHNAQATLGTRFIGFGVQPFAAVPEFLAMADLVVIPQRENLATIGQVPAKVFDAMAMAKPIIATAVSDLPEILAGCGWIVPKTTATTQTTQTTNAATSIPSTTSSAACQNLAQTIQYVLDHPAQAQQAGQNARQKCIQTYSCDAMESALSAVFSPFE